MIKNIRLNKKVLATLMLSSSLALTGCEWIEKDCDIEERHAHLYTNYYSKEDDFYLNKYIESEYIIENDFERTDNYIEITDEEAEKLKAVNKYERLNKKEVGFIVKIDENQDYIDYLSNVCKNYYEYEFMDKWLYPKGTYLSNPWNWGMPTWEDTPNYSLDPNVKNATGNKRLHFYIFRGFNLVEINGEYKMVESEMYFSLDDLIENCEYIDYFCSHKYITSDEELMNYISEKNSKVKIRK